nr:hypothetical protein BaRGS_000314 [Batillaria attramentaria]
MKGAVGGAPSSEQSTGSKHTILLAACSKNELLPQNPELPADLFTSCLTTPIRMALRWYVLHNSGKLGLVPNLTIDMVDKIPGQLNDRRTMLGELNWIFTAITDTIAWNTLPRDLFQKLFRQDLLVASLFRNFLLAERVMHSYNCTPTSLPKLPSTCQHPMWQAWDMTLDLCLKQLPLDEDGENFQHCPFFAEQLTAFQVWLMYGFEGRPPPEQLPIVLQVLLSQVHRLRALDLLGKFLDLGPWAVTLALSVGIFPYVLKLLQSSARELRPLLVFLWAKIMAVDSQSCQAELVKDGGHKYFLSVLGDHSMGAEYRTMAAFILAVMMNEHRAGQVACLQGSVVSTCLEQLVDSSAELRQWLALCLGKVWTNYDSARWCGVRDSAHEKLYKLLSDQAPEVRSAAVFALGTFIFNGSEQTDHASSIELGVAMKLVPCATDGSPLVRKELVVAFSGLVEKFEQQFVVVAARVAEEEKQKDRSSPVIVGEAAGASAPLTLPFNNIYFSVWRAILLLAADPHPEILKLAKEITAYIKDKIYHQRAGGNMNVMHMSSPACLVGSPSSRPANMQQGTPPPKNLMSQSQSAAAPDPQSPARNSTVPTTPTTGAQYSVQFTRHRKMFDKGPSQVGNFPSTHVPVDSTLKDLGVNFIACPCFVEEKDPEEMMLRVLPSKTSMFSWACKQFLRPVMQLPPDKDPESDIFHHRQWRYLRNSRVRARARYDQHRAGFNRLDDQIFVNRMTNVPNLMAFHPYENYLVAADKDSVSVWDWENGTRNNILANGNRHSKISSMGFINPHDHTLLMCGTDDGSVRIWRNFEKEEPGKELVTSFVALSDMLPLTRGSGLVTQWEQENSNLICSGDVRTIRLWDLQTETRKQDIPTGADSCVTSLASDTSGRSLLIAGCGDGTVRLFDRRLAPTECRVMTLREHSSWVVKVHLQRGAEGKIVSASVNGDIRFWDPRFTESVRVLNTQAGLTAVDIHPRADVIACGSNSQSMNIYNESGDVLSTIKYHEGFLGQRIGIVYCLAFHPHLVKLATSSTDGFISVYSTPISKRS